MEITINNPTINFHAAPHAIGRALFAALIRDSEPDDEQIPDVTTESSGRPPIGEYWAGQGGIYVGDFRGDDGSIFGLIAGAEEDIGRATWGPEINLDLSTWDGIANTTSLLDTSPAARLAAGYTKDSHSDFYLPSQRELLMSSANIRHLFGKDGWYATSTPSGKHYAWAVDFEHGHTHCNNRSFEFRVRPFRRFIY